eukprot:8964615-Pyramimonas_sp.AAC.1
MRSSMPMAPPRPPRPKAQPAPSSERSRKRQIQREAQQQAEEAAKAVSPEQLPPRTEEETSLDSGQQKMGSTDTESRMAVLPLHGLPPARARIGG